MPPPLSMRVSFSKVLITFPFLWHFFPVSFETLRLKIRKTFFWEKVSGAIVNLGRLGENGKM